MRYIDEYLKGLRNYPFHMPGHKRNAALFPDLPTEGDITEIEGADDLHFASGIIKASMEKAAALWGAKRSYFLVNGSTCGILAGVTALARRGDKVLCARNCHRSVFHALEIGGLVPVFVAPESGPCFCGSVTPKAVEDALAENADVRLFVLTSPTYEGVISDIKGIAEVCRRHGVPLLVDEAHGAHLDLSPHFTGGAVAAGADAVVQSLHKTLPALTQTAILHLCGDRVDIPRLEHRLRIFETSSPSYILMRSAEYAVEAASNSALFDRWSALLSGFKAAAAGLKNIRLAEKGGAVYDLDRTKLVFTGVNGTALQHFLRTRGIEAEAADSAHLTAMTGPGDTKEGFRMLAEALAEADALLPPCAYGHFPAYPLPEQACGIEEALDAPSEAVPVPDCAGRIAAEYVWAYPPGIPVLIPGERIPPAFAEGRADYRSDSRLLPHFVKVICKNY